MSLTWEEAAEAALLALQSVQNIPYDFERFENFEETQLPNMYIVYFLVSKPSAASADNRERSANCRIQVSIFYKDKSVILSTVKKVVNAFEGAGFQRIGEGGIPVDPVTGHRGWRIDFNFFEKR